MIAASQVSDGYHTFAELYNHRRALFSILVGCVDEGAWKSKLHDDGTMFYGYFIVGFRTPYGEVSYHEPLEFWDSFDCPVVDNAPPWDGHTSDDVLSRLRMVAAGHAKLIKKGVA
jgi:hypothetical protein